MTTSQSGFASLGEAFNNSGSVHERFIQDANGRIAWPPRLRGVAPAREHMETAGKSVLVATRSQIATASALMQLDGRARRVVLCPSGLSSEHFQYVVRAAAADLILSDEGTVRVREQRRSDGSLTAGVPSRIGWSADQTEWVLLTSGTTGLPKLVAHTFASLTAAIQPGSGKGNRVIWSTFYDIRRYGGLQILLRAALTGTSLVLSSAEESTAHFLARAGSSGVTHISGTPSHWRRALMTSSAHLLNPEYVRLSGEPVDQTILNNLRTAYPHARIVHAFASTEAGVAFEVDDGLSGFPAAALNSTPGRELKLVDGTLHIWSAGTARCYLGGDAAPLKDEAGFVDTHDLVEHHDGRCYFVGRRDGVINIGGLKVHPEQVEAVISRHPEVQMCRVGAKKSSITGALMIAEVVLRTGASSRNGDLTAIQDGILQLCREKLPTSKVPAFVKIVPSLVLGASGKVMRQDA